MRSKKSRHMTDGKAEVTQSAATTLEVGVGNVSVSLRPQNSFWKWLPHV
jgi:hypothetical protein